MGHYASEMQCDDCGNIRCTCTREEKIDTRWVIDEETETVMQVFEFDKAKATAAMPGYGMLLRMSLEYFDTKEEAEEELRYCYQMRVDELEDDLSAAEKRAYPDLPTTAEKLQMYEQLLHDIQLFAEVTMDNDKIVKLIRNICSWSYAHRVGNGEYSEEEQDAIVAKAFKKLRDR
jgi:hypothetical protein